MTTDEGRTSSDEIPAVGYFQLFRYSTLKDKLLILLGCIASMIAGIAIPLLNINFGHMIDIYIQFNGLSDFHHDLLRRPRNYTQFHVSFEGVLIEKEVDALNEIPIEVREFTDRCFMIAFNILAIGFVYFVFCYFFTVILSKASALITYRTKLRFYNCLLKHEVAWYDESFVLAYSADIENKFALMEEGMGHKTGFFLYMMSTSICSLLTAVYYGWELTFVLLALTPAFAILFSLVCSSQRRRDEQSLQDREAANAIVREVISLIRLVFSYGGEVKQVLRFERALEKSVKSEIGSKIVASIGYGLVWFSNYLTYAVGVWYGSKLIIVSRETGSHDYTVGQIIIVFWNVLSITYFAGRTGSFLALFQSAATAAGEIFHLIQRESNSHATGIRPNQFSASIQFRKVSLNHVMLDAAGVAAAAAAECARNNDNNNFDGSSCTTSRTSGKCLKDLSLKVDEGETIAVIGRPGSGKSLIPKLLTRIIEQQEGDISLGDIEIHNLNLEWLRSNIGYVGKDPFIFDGTIYDNIWLGDRTSIRPDILEAARIANVDSFIQNLSQDEYDTVVGSKGRSLSPGEKQRIALAKALLKKPKILVLDQVTSGVPVEELDDVTIAIEKARIRRTTVIVSERISRNVRNADRILVIEKGRVVEEGSHDELMRRKGAYRQLLAEQEMFEMNVNSRLYKVRHIDSTDEEDEEEEKLQHSEPETRETRRGSSSPRRQAEESVSDGIDDEEEKEENQKPAKPLHARFEDPEEEGTENKDHGEEEKEIAAEDKGSEEQECSPELMSKEQQPAGSEGGEGVKSSASRKLDSSSAASTTTDSSSITDISMAKERKRSKSCFTGFSYKYSVKRIAKFMERDFAFILMGSICSAIFGLGVPLYAVVVGDFMLVLESQNHEQVLQETKLIAGAFVGLSLLVSIASAASSMLYAVAAGKLAQRLKSQALRSILSQDMEWFGKDREETKKKLTGILCNDVESLGQMVTQRAASYSQTAGTVTACVVYSLHLNWRMGLVAISLMPFIMYRFKIIGSSSSSSSANNKAPSQENEMVRTSKKLIHAVRNSSCLQHQIQFTPIFKKILRQDLQHREGLLHMRGQALAVIQCIPVLAYGIVFLFGSHYIQEGMIHYADFFKIVEGVIFGSILLSEGASFSSDFQDLKGRVGYLFHVIDSRQHADAGSFGSIPDGCDGCIDFSQVYYRSPNPPHDHIFKSFTMQIPRRSSVAIVGQDRDSKMTIACLLQKLYHPPAGAISLDGHDITGINTQWIRSKIAVITSCPQLLSLSIGENIAFGDNNRYVAFAEVVEAAKAAGIHDFIHSLPQGYDTVTDSSALNLEQKLRISIARALLRNPVVVILEQIDSGFDEKSMNQLEDALNSLKKGRSVISLPCSFAWNGSYDQVVLIQNAAVGEEGSHQDLMRRSSNYFDLYKLYE